MNNKNLDFNNWVHNFGILSSLILIILMLAVPIVACTVFDMWPNLVGMIPTLIAIAMMFVPFCIGECIAYPPIIGPGSVYMAYITGNTSTLKLPCALNALSIAEVEKGTDEANAVSLIAVGVSSLTVIIIIILGIILSIPLYPVLNNPILAPGFGQVVPALMGALLGSTIVGNVKYYVAPLIVAIWFEYFTSVGFEFYMLISIAVSMFVGYYLNKKKMYINEE
ncbi:MAG: hypothetical protein PHT02_11280 [Tissierellia bacterium]|nr:hypothetical protein [Tissierellia bacterium]